MLSGTSVRSSSAWAKWSCRASSSLPISRISQGITCPFEIVSKIERVLGVPVPTKVYSATLSWLPRSLAVPASSSGLVSRRWLLVHSSTALRGARAW